MLVLLVLIAFSISGVWSVYKKERESATLREQVVRERAELLNREAKLESDIARLQSDRGLEETLREQYALAEEGEKLIVIVEAPTPEPSAATSTIVDKLRSFFWFW